MFKGTPTRSADDVNREFDEMGAHYNAFTSEENTVYYAAVLPEYQTGAVELLADIIRPSLREEDFDTEKQVIIEEIRMYEDQPPFGADEKCKAAALRPRTRWAAACWARSKASPTCRSKRCAITFSAATAPATSTLVGRRADRLRHARRRRPSASAAPGNPSPPRAKRRRPRPPSGLRVPGQGNRHAGIRARNWPAARRPKTPIATPPKSWPRSLGDDSGSRLYWALVDTGLAEQASLSHHDYQGAGMFMTYMCCEADEAQANLAADRRNLLPAPSATASRAEELAQAKSKINSRVVLSSERPRGRLFNVGGNWIQRHEYRTVQQDLAAIDAVTCDDMHGASSASYPLTTATTLAIGPAKALKAPR